jgi:hypothetical protein
MHGAGGWWLDDEVFVKAIEDHRTLQIVGVIDAIGVPAPSSRSHSPNFCFCWIV